MSKKTKNNIDKCNALKSSFKEQDRYNNFGDV